jgi:putative transposase
MQTECCATMKAQDVTATLDLALTASGLDQMTVFTGHGSCQTTARHISRAILPIGWTNRTSSMSVERPTIRRPRARSSAGIKRSRTASCGRSRPSSSIIIMPAITRAWAISHRLTSI